LRLRDESSEVRICGRTLHEKLTHSDGEFTRGVSGSDRLYQRGDRFLIRWV
jgi:hypothetical protein